MRKLFRPDHGPVITPEPGIASDGVVGLSIFNAQSSVSGLFIPSAGILNVMGSSPDDTIEVSRNAAGQLSVNDGAVAIRGGTPTVANTSQIIVTGLGGDDVISLNEQNGALPNARLFGGVGDDILTGGSGNDQIFGQGDDDQLFGKGGSDLLFGGAGDDVLTGGDGGDQMFGESGNDRMIWNPGDDSDLMEGGAGIDTAEINGGGGAETFTITANGTRVLFNRLDPAPFGLDIGTSENLVLNANGGDDVVTVTGNLAPLINITIDGGAGDDSISGGNGADLLIGGEGDDFIDGQQGSDVAFLGAGNDVFQWDPGDGSDVIEGQDGQDTMLFNGSAASETFDLSANGERLRFTRNIGNIVMDTDDVETVELNALGGSDTVVINDLTGTDVSEVFIDLAGTLGGTTGDSQPDTIVVNGTQGGGDFVEVVGDGDGVAVIGLPTLVNLKNLEGANDSLVINALGGGDFINASTLDNGIVKLTIDGGAGADYILGSQGNDVLLAGDGDDFVDGQQGNDVAFLGAGDDIFQWDPGDGSDVVEGQDGTDDLLFNGSNASEIINVVANGGRVLFTRNVGNITMDLNGIENIHFNALGGADEVVVGDLSGTDVERIRVDLHDALEQPDGAQDSVTVTGSNSADDIQIRTVGDEVLVTGLAAEVQVFGVDANGIDRVTLNALGGDDTLDASNLSAGQVQLTMNGGLGDDGFIGSNGDDLFNGGDGDDVAFMGGGDDTFVWNPGDDNDTLFGEDGFDTMLFNGSNVSETIDISANGTDVRFFRDVANVVMENSGVERIQFNALGGADTIVVNDLSGTDLTQVDVNLAASGGTGDAQPDNVIANATNADDVVLVFGDAAGVAALGLAAQINVTGAEGANDRLTINTLGGDDIVDASGLQLGAIQLVINGGDGNDVLIGSDGDDVLIGGAGDDVILGGLGNDIIDGGDGDDIEIQGFMAGAGSDDRIDLSGRGLTFEAVMAHARDVDGDTLLEVGGQVFTLKGVASTSLHHDDFLV